MGQFKKRILKGLLAERINQRDFKVTDDFVYVEKFEEKGSDVNIASHIISDSYEKRADVVMLISNDSDLEEPLKITKSLGLRVVLITPAKNHVEELKKHADKSYIIKPKQLNLSQFEDSLKDSKGVFYKPSSWVKRG